MTRQAKHRKRPGQGRGSISKSAASKPAPAQPGLQTEILNLQRSAGNKVVSQLLQDEAGEKHHANVESPLVDSTLNSEGQPLDAAARSQMETLFNEDFSGVRIHTDAEAAESAQNVEARAYTSGEDVVFGANQYRPNTEEGKQLIAHELAHTVQHRDAGHSSSPGAGTSISRAPLGGARDPISLFPEIPAPVVSRIGNMLVATVYFGQKFFLLDPRNLEAVEKFGDELKFVLNPSIAVNGYASSEGDKAYNQRLSENRRETVIAILKSKMTGAPTFTGKGHGATDLAEKETGKKGPELEGQKALNRRVTIVATLPAAPAKPAGGTTPGPTKELPEDEFSPVEPEGPKPIDLRPRIPYRPETPREMGERMMREAAEAEKIRKEREAQKRLPSLNEFIFKKVDDAVDVVAKKLKIPEKWRPYLKDAVRAGIEKGTEAAVDGVLDQTGLGSEEKEAIKKAIEAASKTKLK